MNYTEKLQNVTVLGAAGKMGSGILLLTALEMGDLSLKPENKNTQFILYAMDINQKALTGLMNYIYAQVFKAAEKKVVALRKVYADRKDLIDNDEIIGQYVRDVMNILRPVTTIESAYESSIIFEAASENPELKIKMFSKINENNPNKPWFFTNTSSIPIEFLDKEARLEGRVLGVHFYNPPAVQKLVEVIKTEHTLPELPEFTTMFIKNLKKIEVPSYDKAGFIGNGHFMRDALHGMSEAIALTNQMPFVEAVYCINKVTQDFMIRPMGIFQLIDYVGIDVCQYIMKVMRPHVKDEDIHSGLLDSFIEMEVKGGQNSDGSQKDGFLKYEKGKVIGIFDPASRQYVDIDAFSAKCDAWLGDLPASCKPWKAVVGKPDRDSVFTTYFSELKNTNINGAKLAMTYLKKSKDIGLKLVSDKVAYNENDVNTVLLTGFFHAYGPINNYID
jgi:3-hydroxyacyl-CoA dehydrogenase